MSDASVGFNIGTPPPQQPQGKTSMELTVNRLIDNLVMTRRELTRMMNPDPRRDFDKEFGYPTDVPPTMLRAFYNRVGIAHRVVEVLADECWQDDPDVYETSDAEATPFEDAVDALAKKLNLWAQLALADEVSGIGRFGIVLLGLSDGGALDSPAPGINLLTGEAEVAAKPTTNAEGELDPKQVEAQKKLLFVRSLDESVVVVVERETNIASPRFGQPTMYEVTFAEQSASAASGTEVGISQVTDQQKKKVHWTRVIHLADNREMGSEIYGAPRMMPVFNLLCDLRKVAGGSGEMFWRGAFPGISFKIDPSINEAEVDNESMKNMLEDWANGLKRYLALTGVEAKSLEPQIADPRSHFDVIMEQICVTLGVPVRVFMGTEEGKLAGGQDSKAWAKRKFRRQNKYQTPMIIRPLIDRLIAFGILPTPKSYNVAWPDPNSASEQDQIDNALKITQALAAYIAGGVDQIMPPDVYLVHVHGFDADEVEAFLKAAAEFQATKPKPEESDDAQSEEDPRSKSAAKPDKAASK